MQNYPNERIINTISQQQFFSPDSVKIAQEIAVERNLLHHQQIDSLNNKATITRSTPANDNYSSAYQYTADNEGPSVVGIIFGILIIIKFLILIARFN